MRDATWLRCQSVTPRPNLLLPLELSVILHGPVVIVVDGETTAVRHGSAEEQASSNSGQHGVIMVAVDLTHEGRLVCLKPIMISVSMYRIVFLNSSSTRRLQRFPSVSFTASRNGSSIACRRRKKCKVR